MSIAGLFSKPQTVEIKDLAVTRVRELKSCNFLYCVTPVEVIIFILFQVILGCICNMNLVFNFHAWNNCESFGTFKHHWKREVKFRKLSNGNKIISYLQTFFNSGRKLEVQDKIGTIVCFYRKCFF